MNSLVSPRSLSGPSVVVFARLRPLDATTASAALAVSTNKKGDTVAGGSNSLTARGVDESAHHSRAQPVTPHARLGDRDFSRVDGPALQRVETGLSSGFGERVGRVGMRRGSSGLAGGPIPASARRDREALLGPPPSPGVRPYARPLEMTMPACLGFCSTLAQIPLEPVSAMYAAHSSWTGQTSHSAFALARC